MSKVKDDALKEATKRIKLQPRNAYPGPGHLECLGREKDPVRIEIDVERAKRLAGYAGECTIRYWNNDAMPYHEVASKDRIELDRLIGEAEGEG